MEGEYTNSSKLIKILPNNIKCGFTYGTESYQEMMCYTTLFGNTITYISSLHYKNPKKAKSCYASPDTTDITNKVCQNETGKNTSTVSCTNTYCRYDY